MKDIEIKISQETRMVDLKKTVIGNDAENLQGNLIFSFTDDFVNGTARLEYEISGNKRYIMLEKNNNTYSVPIKSVLTKKGQINMQLVITEGTSENDIPIFKSNIFYVFCNQSINAEIEQPDEYPSWIEIANAKINEVDEAILGIEEAKRYAIEQGDYAKEQGDYAKAQGDYAKTQKIEVVKANEEANKIISDFEKNVDEYTTTFNENVENKTNDFDNNASEKLSVYNTNAEIKNSEFNTNVANQTKAFNDNANDKLNLYNQNDTTKTSAFNDNATNKTTAFNSNANSKTETYNNNHTEKINAYNTNATNKTTEFNTNAISKINEYNTNADNKIAEYDEHSQELDNKIIDTRNELERVKNDVLETGTDTDTYIHLEDSAMAEYQELSIDGVCEQKTTSGKQLYKYDDLLTTYPFLTYDEDGYYTFTADRTSESSNLYYNFKTNNLDLKLNTNYSIITEIKSVSYSGTYKLNTVDRWGQFSTALSYSNASVGTYVNTRTTKEEEANNGLSSNVFVASGSKVTITFRISVMEDTTITPSNFKYEPYTGGQPSPSPDFSQSISTIENSLKITSCNKNLCNGISQGLYLTSTGNNFGKTIVDSGLCIKCDGTSSYTISSNIIQERYRIAFTKENPLTESQGVAYGGSNLDGSNSTISKSSFGYKYLIVNATDLSNIQIEQNPTATEYEQHIETQITANLPEGEFIGKISETIKDTLKVEYNEDDGQYHLNLYKRVYKNNSYNGESYNYYISTTARKDGNIECGELQTGQVVYYDGDETIIDLGVVDQLITYNEITNLFTDSDLLPTINAKYYRNFISTVRNLQVNEKALKQELVDINNRLSVLETAQTNTTSESEVVE